MLEGGKHNNEGIIVLEMKHLGINSQDACPPLLNSRRRKLMSEKENVMHKRVVAEELLQYVSATTAATMRGILCSRGLHWTFAQPHPSLTPCGYCHRSSIVLPTFSVAL